MRFVLGPTSCVADTGSRLGPGAASGQAQPAVTGWRPPRRLRPHGEGWRSVVTEGLLGRAAIQAIYPRTVTRATLSYGPITITLVLILSLRGPRSDQIGFIEPGLGWPAARLSLASGRIPGCRPRRRKKKANRIRAPGPRAEDSGGGGWGWRKGRVWRPPWFSARPRAPARARGRGCLKCVQGAKPTPRCLFGILARDSELSCVARDRAVHPRLIPGRPTRSGRSRLSV